MAKLQILPRMLPNKGLVLSKPEEILKNSFSVGDSRNLEFFNEYLQGRLGLLKMDTAVLSGPVLHKSRLRTFSGSVYEIFCTTKDIYKYDFTNTRFDILTPLYTTGHILIGTGAASNLFAGSGPNVDFVTGGVSVSDYLKIGTGSPTTDDSWFEVKSVAAGTGAAAILTMTTGATITLPTGAAAQQYTIRKCFQGTSTNFWHSREYQDAVLTETWIATNGVDTPIRWSGSGQVVPMTSAPAGFVSAKYIEVYKDRVLFLHTIEAGNQPQRIRWSAVANCESWGASDFTDLITDGHWIKGSVVCADYHVVFREKDAYVGRWVGGDNIFDWEKSNSCQGLRGENSIVVNDRYIYYYGDDNKFHVFDLLSDRIITEGIFPHTKDYNPTLRNYIYGYKVDRKNHIRWHCPFGDTLYNNETVVYDYQQDIVQIWEYEQEQACCSIGEYEITVDLYLDDTVWGEYYLDEQEGYFDDNISLDEAPVLIYGGYDGYVRKADIGYDDDGTTYNRIFESIRDNFGLPHMNKRLWKQQIWLESRIAGSVTIKLKKDDGVIFEATTANASLIDASRDIIKKNITWNCQAQNFKTRIEATNHFSLLGYINYVFQKGKTIA